MKRLGRLALGAALVALVVLGGRAFGERIPAFAAWVEAQGVLGPVVFAAGYAIAVVALVPGSVLTLAAGAIFGLGRGVLVVFAGAVTGSALAFLIARYFARGALERRFGQDPRFASIDGAIEREGRRMVFLLRLSPVFPFSLLNYALGLTRVRFADYLAASAGMLPGTVLYVYYGKVAGDVAALAGGAAPSGGAGRWVVLGLGLAATVAVTFQVTRLARRSLASVAGRSA